MKKYSIIINFETIEIIVQAKNRTEAKKKFKEKLAKKNALKLFDKNHTYIDEI